jgi:16S rRNA (guanine(1405)-N(7))-methyltransferase
MNHDVEVEAVVTAVKQSAKYGDTSEATIRELAAEAVRQHKKSKPAIKAVRARLHSIMAPYLGDPDYAAEAARLEAAFAAHNDAAIAAICQDCLHAHLSTRERLPIMAEFYERIFAITGQPQSVLDIACGLNPLALRWMGLGSVSSQQLAVSSGRPVPGLRFYAYDIHEPRIAFINHYLQLEGLESLARVQDVAMNFPQEEADVALFLKEMPRFERNYGGRGRPLLESLHARFLVISYPTISTHGGRNLTNRYREFMFQLIQGHDWPVTELLFAGELVFVVEKGLEIG